MSPEELIFRIPDMLREHIKLPEGYEWLPLAVIVCGTGLGLLMLARGAKWAPGLAGLGFMALGGAAGAYLGSAIAIPMWISAGILGGVGLAIGIVGFRLWQASLLATCFAIAGLSIYYVRGLQPEVENWHSGTGTGFVTLQPAGTVVGESRPDAMDELSSLWSHLSTNVPNFQPTFWGVTGLTALVGFVIGFFLPRFSRSLWAASIGTCLVGVGSVGLFKSYAPGALDWLMADNTRAWAIVGGVWVLSLGWNLLTLRKRRAGKADSGAANGKGSPALA